MDRRMGQGSVAQGQRGSGDGGGIHRRMNAIKSGGGGGHSHTNHTTHGGTYRLPNTPHDKMGKFFHVVIWQPRGQISLM